MVPTIDENIKSKPLLVRNPGLARKLSTKRKVEVEITFLSS